MSDSDFLGDAEGATTAELPSALRILRAANAVYNDNPVLPLPPSDVADRAHVSRALIYAHYPDQYELASRLIALHVKELSPNLFRALSDERTFSERAETVGHVLFNHFLANGLLLANAPQDDFLRHRLPPEWRRLLSVGLKRLASQARHDFGFSRRQALAAILILAVIPEQASRLVRNGQISEETGRANVTRGIRLSVATFQPDQPDPPLA